MSNRKYDILQYDETGQGKFDTGWYATVWESGGTVKMTIKGFPHNTVFSFDRRAVPQLINILKEIQNV